MIKYLLMAAVLFCTNFANAELPKYSKVQDILTDVKSYEDNADKRAEYLKLFDYYLKSGKLKPDVKKMIEQENNRLSLVGKELELYGEDLGGKELCICHEKYQNKVVVIDFWASWCGPCKTEIEHLKKVYYKYRGDVEFLGVNIDENAVSAARSKIQLNIPWKNFRRTKEIEEFMDKYGIRFIPRVMVVGPDGKVVKLNEKQNLEKVLDELTKLE